MDIGQNNVCTLVFPILKEHDLVILGHGAEGKKIGAGVWNGFGGSVEQGESIRAGAKREFREETKLLIEEANLNYRGKAIFNNQTPEGKPFVVLVHMFVVFEWTGKLELCSEFDDVGIFQTSCLPKDVMPADSHFMHRVLFGTQINDEYWYGPGQKTLLKFRTGVLNGEGDVE